MKAEIFVFGSWFTFAIAAYLILICIFGLLWFYRVKSNNYRVDWTLVGSNMVFAILSLVGAIFTIVLYAQHGKAYLDYEVTAKTSEAVKNEMATIETYYTANFFTNLIIIIGWVIFLVLFSNNFALKFTNDKTYLFGLSILNSAIIKIGPAKKYIHILEYVFKKDGNNKWTEKCRFWNFSATTKYLMANYTQFIDCERNKAFFDLHKVEKSPVASESQSPPSSTTPSSSEPKPLPKE